MNAALNDSVVPVLREMGFKGSLPHFRRERDEHIDLLTVQYNKYGGSFLVEISFADPARENVYLYRDTPANKLRVAQTRERFRLGADHENWGVWLAFSGRPASGITGSPSQLADVVVGYIRSQASAWWNKHRAGEEKTSG